MRLQAVVLLVVLCFWGCYRMDIKENSALNRSSWDGYVCVHNFSLNEQVAYLEPLINAGAMRGVRMDRLEDNNELVYWLHARGVDVLGIFDNEHLRDPNVVEIFLRYVQEFPFIDNWEIGNEVDYFVKPSMTAKEYMDIFGKIYQASRGWGVTIISQAPFGTMAGAGFLKEMVDNGLGNYPDIIVAIHYYAYGSKAIHDFAAQISRLSYRVPIWVTETGVKDHSKHIGYVNDIYPDIRNVLRADRIYWYTFSNCDEHSLVQNLSSECGGEVVLSPLYSQLTGIDASNVGNNIVWLRRTQ